jgi:exonuclease SbcD
MRFLHTSDWHVGKTIGGRSRADEHRAVLAEILSIAREGGVDCLLVTGDVFESAAPGAEAEKVVYDFFRDLGRAAIPAVVIAGNHDHERKLGAVASLLEIVDVHVRHDFVRPEMGGVFTLESRRGETAAIGAVPFIPEHKMVEASVLMEETGTAFDRYAERMAAILGAFAGALAPHPIRILLAHLHVEGSKTGGGERSIHIGDTYAVPAARLPRNLHYLALGHLHRPQDVAAPSPARFAGSPLALDFGERGQEKSVVLVEVTGPHLPARLETVPLRAGRGLRDVRGTLADLTALAPSLGDDYLRVVVTAATPIAGLAEEVRRLLPNAVQVQLETNASRSEGATPTRTEQGLGPSELYSDFHARRHGQPPSPELLALFRELYGAAAAEEEA